MSDSIYNYANLSVDVFSLTGVCLEGSGIFPNVGVYPDILLPPIRVRDEYVRLEILCFLSDLSLV